MRNRPKNESKFSKYSSFDEKNRYKCIHSFYVEICENGQFKYRSRINEGSYWIVSTGDGSENWGDEFGNLGEFVRINSIGSNKYYDIEKDIFEKCFGK